MMRAEHRFASVGLLGGLTAFVVVLLAAPPPTNDGRVVAVFAPWMSEERTFSAVIASGSIPVGSWGRGVVWAIEVRDGGGRALKALGALAVIDGNRLNLPLGCVNPDGVSHLLPARSAR